MNPDTPEAVKQKAMRHKTPEMTRHYSHTFETQQRKAVESTPDLTQPSMESQTAAKTGTDDRNVTEEILSKSCFQGAPIRSNTEASGKQNIDSVQKTALRKNNEGAVRIDSPMHKNAKSLPNRDLLPARNGAYKSAYKQNRKNAIDEAKNWNER